MPDTFRYVPAVDVLLRGQLPLSVLALLADRDRQLEDRLAGLGVGGLELAWGVEGALTVGESTDYPVFVDRTLTKFYAKIQATTTTSTVLEPRYNGVAVPGAGITLAAGTDVEDEVALSVVLSAGGVYSIGVTTAGGSAQYLQTVSVVE